MVVFIYLLIKNLYCDILLVIKIRKSKKTNLIVCTELPENNKSS
jgi:hypothetical protein